MKLIGRELKITHVLIKRCLNSFKCGKDENTDMNRRVMVYMYEHKGEDIYQKDIENHFSLCRSSASGLIDRMIEKGLIEAFKASDKRLKKLVLTEKAMDCIEAIKLGLEEFEKKLAEGISQEELDSFFNVLEKINNNINKLTVKGEGDAHC